MHVGLVPDVAELTADGRSAAEIASILGITQRIVVRHHRTKEDRMTCTRKPTPPPADQPRLPDGSVDVRALCAQLDAAANVGAGKPRTR